MKNKCSAVFVLICILMSGLSQGASLIAHYTFDDAENSSADASGNGNTLAVYPGYGTPMYSAEGKLGGATVFNSGGATTQGWVTGNTILTPSFTFAAWVKPMGTSSMVMQSWSLISGYQIYIVNGTYRVATMSAEPMSYKITSAVPTIGSWQHIALTYTAISGPNGSGTYTGTMTAYVDGQMVGTLANAKYAMPANNFLTLGRRSTAFFNGLMDEVYICNGALAAAEIQGLVALTPPVFEQNFSMAMDRTNAIYEVNSQAGFIVTAPENGTLAYVLTRDGKDIIEQATVSCSAGTNVIEGTLAGAGFLKCVVTYTPLSGGNPKTLTAAAAFEPEAIAPAQNHMPADFDSFWLGKKQELAAIPMDVSMSAISSLDPSVSMYDIDVPCLGNPVRGYYGKPSGAETGKCPAIVFFQGAGVASAAQGRVIDYCKEGFIGLEINAHGIPNGQPADYYSNLANTDLAGYAYFGRENPDDCYFTGMFLRVFRALEFMKSQPEWDGRNLVVYGSSQGGAQAIAGAGLDPNVTFLVAGVPAMCDHGGEICGWPRLIPIESDGSYNLGVLNTSRYVDSVNFASKTAASAFFTVGFIDTTCRPTSVYAMYNTYGGPKEIVNMPLMQHSFPVENAVAAKSRVLESITSSTGGQGGFIFYIRSQGDAL